MTTTAAAARNAVERQLKKKELLLQVTTMTTTAAAARNAVERQVKINKY